MVPEILASSFTSRRSGQSDRPLNNPEFPIELRSSQSKAFATDIREAVADLASAAIVAEGSRSDTTGVLMFASITPLERFVSLLELSPSDFSPEPLRPVAQAIPELGGRLLTTNRPSNPLQLFRQRQSATRHSLLFLLFSRNLGRNSLGGVIA